MFSQYGPMQVSSPCVGSVWFSSRYFLAVASRSLLHLKGGLPEPEFEQQLTLQKILGSGMENNSQVAV